jgi:hypothetical protein
MVYTSFEMKPEFWRRRTTLPIAENGANIQKQECPSGLGRITAQEMAR